MKWNGYLKERAGFLFINAALLVFMELYLYLINVQVPFMILLAICWAGPLLLTYMLDWYRHRKYFKTVNSQLDSLDQTYLLPEVIAEPKFEEGRIFYEILAITNKQMHEHINEYKKQQLEYRDYIEAWVHEIKTPIASSKLILQKQKNEASRAVLAELEAVEGFIEQTLYYARSSSASKDYRVKEFRLGQCVARVIKKNARGFIHNKVRLDLQDIEEVVFSDEKWVDFMLTQIIVNSINYCKGDDKCITISSSKQENNVVLKIADNGIGIDQKDIKRVFDKGFTGENGRLYGKSTGMGLYLCKKLAEKLHLGITIQSEKGKGTEVELIFPTSKIVLLES